MVRKSLTAMVKRLAERLGSKFGGPIAASSNFQASCTNGAIASARAVGCIPLAVRTNNSSPNISLNRASA